MSEEIEFALSGQAVLIANLEVSLSLSLPEKDQSGQASSTASSEKGVKAKELKVSGLIPYTRPDQLALLYSLAEAGGKTGRVRYRVNCDLASTVKFRQATFTGSVSAVKASGLQAWQISFTLREVNSVAEKKAGKGAAAVSQTASGTGSAEEGPEQLTRFEKILKAVNDKIGA